MIGGFHRDFFPSQCEVKIEQKLFIISSVRRGYTVRLTERTRQASFVLEIERDSLHWILNTLWEYINKPHSCPKFNRFRGSAAVFSIQKFTNGRGNYLEVSKFVWKGKRQRVIIPSGKYELGWRSLAFKLSKFMLLKKVDTRFSIEDYKFTGLGKMATKHSTTENTNALGKLPSCLAKDWSSAIIITRDCAITSWDLVRITLGKAVNRKIEIFPFRANKAIWWPDNEEDASFYLRLRKCFLEKRVTLSFERWRSNINSEEEVFECCDSWVRVLGLPWDLWSTETFKIIGNQCGGLLDISPDTILLKDLSAAKIKVVGLQGGFINSSIQIPSQKGPIVIRIVVDSLNLSAYEIYEKRSYAQVVVNGARVLAGWGLNGRAANLPPKDNSNSEAELQKIRQLDEGDGYNRNIQNGQSQNLIEKAHMNEQKNNSSHQKTEDQHPTQVPLFPGRKIKILRKLSPKGEDNFKRTPINSMNVSSSKAGCQPHLQEEDGKFEDSKFHFVYQRRNFKAHMPSSYNEGREQQKTKQSMVIGELLELEDDSWDAKRLKEEMGIISEGGFETSDVESHISATSDELSQISSGFQDLGDFFQSSPSKVCLSPKSPLLKQSTFLSFPPSVSLGGRGGSGVLEFRPPVGNSILVQELGLSGNNSLGHRDGSVSRRRSSSVEGMNDKLETDVDCLEQMGIQRVELTDSNF